MARPPVLVNRGWVSQIFALRATRPASIDPATRAERALPEDLIRLCVGIEDVHDLIQDLENAVCFDFLSR